MRPAPLGLGRPRGCAELREEPRLTAERAARRSFSFWLMASSRARSSRWVGIFC